MGFDVSELLGGAVSLRHRPAGALPGRTPTLLLGREPNPSGRPDTGRDRDGEGVDQLLHARSHIGDGEARSMQAHAAVDVVADTARTHDPVLRIGGDDAADRKTVALVDVGHRERCLDDSGQGGGVRHLLERAVAPDGLHEGVVGVDESRDPHAWPRVPRDAPEIGGNLFDLHGSLRTALRRGRPADELDGTVRGTPGLQRISFSLPVRGEVKVCRAARDLPCEDSRRRRARRLSRPRARAPHTRCRPSGSHAAPLGAPAADGLQRPLCRSIPALVLADHGVPASPKGVGSAGFRGC